METCCDVLGKELKNGKRFMTNGTASGKEWIPAFVQKVDAEKCTGCGSCFRVCLGGCYEMREATIKGKKKKVAVTAHPENCLGDCHCHKVCPVPEGAMFCRPKVITAEAGLQNGPGIMKVKTQARKGKAY